MLASGPREGCPQLWFAFGPQRRTVLRNVDGVPASGRDGRRESDEDERGADRQSKRTDAVAFVDARLLYRDSADPGMPEAHGLYDPALAKDSCGVGFIADIKGRKSHQIVEDALTILVNLEHRGAVGADPRAGDGAGILVQIPHKFFARKAKALGITLPTPGEYGIGALFMPRDAERRELVRKTFEEVAAREGLSILGWRADMPIDNSTLGETVKPTEPFHMQVFIGKGKPKLTEDEFERRLYILRKSISVDDLPPVRAAAVGLLPGVDLVPHRDLQGHVPRRPARHLLSRSAASRISRARWRWCISASPPTPSRPGRWRIPTG